MNKLASGTNPGLLYVASKIIQPRKLSTEQYTDWYEKIVSRAASRISPGILDIPYSIFQMS